jgi:hypothetical protein
MQGLLTVSVVPVDQVVELQANELAQLLIAIRFEGSKPPRPSYAGSAGRAQGELPGIS